MSKSREMQVDITKITDGSGAFPCLLALSEGNLSCVGNGLLIERTIFQGRITAKPAAHDDVTNRHICKDKPLQIPEQQQIASITIRTSFFTCPVRTCPCLYPAAFHPLRLACRCCSAPAWPAPPPPPCQNCRLPPTASARRTTHGSRR
ncbi:hypothetical protein D3C76_1301260 [compost metagenome]